ncbi:protein-ADP-ribose hydrolase [Clostridium massiliamazoniense]|uniref:protein-ADP-ribose hydrolase n=1 Tax=Clostridium massiliamazoniense TaxID=1347366 RepID=UPI0006D815E2
MKELDFLINKLIEEDEKYKDIKIPREYSDKKNLLRALMNVRMAGNIDKEFLEVQNKFLTKEVKEKGVITLDKIETVDNELGRSKDNNLNKKLGKISIWQGDITTLAVDAIVNAANSELLGCFVPCHRCIDNAIHSQAGIELREECFELMKEQGHLEETGKAKITKGYNLPAKHVIHTVGPIVYNGLTESLRNDLKSSYKSCLELMIENNLRTIAFCCISTGEFHFPNGEAAKIALKTVLEFLEENGEKVDRIIFNVFKDIDKEIYSDLIKDLIKK